ncbi:MAG TPA: Rrf2 family transcriptional regulator [Actinomycetota bacterium]|nr:Rrf2 family transcriptional regulator [Actinomycetota bacterium]
MRFSQKTEYALRALLELGAAPVSGPISAREIARSQRIPVRFLEQVLAELRRGGLITSQRGASGGAVLARDPETITVGEVIDLLEGPVVGQACLDPFADQGRAVAHSAVQELWLDLQITIRERLAGVTIADLVRRQAELDRSSYLAFQI